ncbi:MAG TPA: discoidin domain-containing protein [Holophaga sp.]|nr:discoidin domain-containing protein [Holophaga sp.]
MFHPLPAVPGLVLAATLPAAPPTVLDAFPDVKAWSAAPSDGVRLDLSRAAGPEGAGALRMAWDFQGRAGYAAARRKVALRLPANYEISFLVRGEGLPNGLEFKLVDPSGDNVWWVRKPTFAFPGQWTRVVMKKRHVSFAWGPGGADPGVIGSLEWCVVAGQGGRGWAEFAGLSIRELPPERPYAGTPRATRGPGWHQVDFGETRPFGGVRIDWAGRAPAAFVLKGSGDGRTWTSLREAKGAGGATAWIQAPEAEYRYLRVEGPGAAVRALEALPLAFGSSPNALVEAVAKAAPRGDYPRGFIGEQGWWTLVGVDGGRDCGLLSEDGALEAGKARPAVEPFLWDGARLLGWAQAESSQSLAGDGLPIPTATRRMGDLVLRTTAYGAGTLDAPVLRCRYQVSREGGKPFKGALFLALRPFQVNPPAQFLGVPGGVAPIRSLAFDGQGALVEGRRLLVASTRPDGYGAKAFMAGPLLDDLRQGRLPAAPAVTDPDALASGALRYDLDLAPGETREICIDLPLGGETGPLPSFQAGLEAATRFWEDRLDRVKLDLPVPGAAATLRTCLAHILISRQGPALRPGTRSYARSWIRDGAMMGAALLRLGHAQAAMDYLAWYAPNLFPDGKVPCVVDERGSDPVPENDSHGEFIHLLAEIGRFTGDRAFVARWWPQAQAAAQWMARHREAADGPQGEPWKGLMPRSISHEGYSAKPMHSFWDDFWALRGLKDAAWIAAFLGQGEEAARWEREALSFRQDVQRALRETQARHGIDFLPGCVELGDFDATSTTIALLPGGEQAHLPAEALHRTFDRFYAEVMRRRKGEGDGRYTPYELRAVGAYAFLGQPERAGEMLEGYLADRRPLAWNQWPEVNVRNPRQSEYLGDLPHAWVGSDYLRSLLAMLLLERESDGAWVLGAGVPEAWLANEGLALAGLRVPGGQLGWRLRREGGRVLWDLEGDAVPAGGLALRWPLAGTFRRATVDGHPVAGEGKELIIKRLPARVVMEP